MMYLYILSLEYHLQLKENTNHYNLNGLKYCTHSLLAPNDMNLVMIAKVITLRNDSFLFQIPCLTLQVLLSFSILLLFP